MGTFIELIRVRQWYKNLVIFLPLIFIGDLFVAKELMLTAIGFASLCLVSSAAYIINDIADMENDQVHPEKKMRPIAAGKVGTGTAILVSIILLALAIILAAPLSRLFVYAIIGIFLITGVYTFGLKNEPFADILAIAVNFVIRASSGAFIINADISPWLILCTFFLSLFLSAGKRASDFKFLNKKAAEHRSTLKYYNEKITGSLLTISTTLLITSYSLFSFLSVHPLLVLTLPFALYVIFRYMNLVYAGKRIARHPEEAVKDKRLMIGAVMWVLSVILIIYI